MNKAELYRNLTKSYGDFSSAVSKLAEADFLYSLNGQKWSAGQQLDHLCRSVSPLNQAFGMPKLALRAMFGKASGPSRSYEEVVSGYQQKLAEGGAASGRFLPKEIGFEAKNGLLEKLEGSVSKLCSQLESFSEDDLDKFLLPHPLLGKLTLREMLCFSIYHAGHHQKQVEENLAGINRG